MSLSLMLHGVMLSWLGGDSGQSDWARLRHQGPTTGPLTLQRYLHTDINPTIATFPAAAPIPATQSRDDAATAAGAAPDSWSEQGTRLLQPHYFSAAELQRKPYLLADFNPTYPVHARSDEVVVVQLRLLISAAGMVDRAMVENHIHETATPQVFAEAAVAAVNALRFAPGLRDGQSVPSQLRLELRYTP